MIVFLFFTIAPVLYPTEVMVYSRTSSSVHIEWRGVSTNYNEENLEGYKVIRNKQCFGKRGLTHSHTMTPFGTIWETRLLKTLWEKEKLLVTSNFFFFPVFSTHLDNFLPFSSNLKLSSANSFSLEESEICRLVMG